MRDEFGAFCVVDPTRSEAFCALVPALRMAAVGLIRRADAADDLVHDALLQGILLCDRWETTDLLPELLSRMRNAFHTRTRLSGWTGRGRDEPEGAALALRILALPTEERGPLIFVRLLGLHPELACGLCGCGESTFATRLRRAERRAMAGPFMVPPAPVADLLPHA